MCLEGDVLAREDLKEESEKEPDKTKPNSMWPCCMLSDLERSKMGQ